MNVSIKEIISIVSIQLGIRNVVEDHRLVEDLGAESADVANIIAAVEDKYQVLINEEMIARIRSVKDLYITIIGQLSDTDDR